MTAEKREGTGNGSVNGLRGPEIVPKVVRRVKVADDKLIGFVRERPLVSLGAAIAVGYLIGRIFARLD